MAGYVCLTFDFDAISVWLQRNMLTMTAISRGEYGAVAVPRILHLLKTRNIKSTWFIPGHTMETYPDLCLEIYKNGHEIALHGYAHENFNLLKPEEEWYIMQRCYDIAGELIGENPKGFRSPSWDLSSRTLDHLQKLGLLYDSSLMGNDFALYHCRKHEPISATEPFSFGAPTKIVEVPVSWSLDDYPHFEFVRMPHAIMQSSHTPAMMYANWYDDLKYMLRDFDEGVMTVTFHPQVTDRGHRFLALEKWLDLLMHEEIRFCRIDQLVEAFNRGKKLGQHRPL